MHFGKRSVEIFLRVLWDKAAGTQIIQKFIKFFVHFSCHFSIKSSKIKDMYKLYHTSPGKIKIYELRKAQ